MVKQIVIIGASRAGQVALNSILKRFKSTQVFVSVVEKDSDFFWYIGSPRAIIDPEFANKMIYSYDKLFSSPEQGELITASVMSFDEHIVSLSDGTTLKYDYLILASGTTFGDGKSVFKTRPDSEIFLSSRDKIKTANSVVIVGGGPTGIETAAEIKTYFPEKKVTLIHSGDTLLHATDLSKASKSRILKKVLDLGIIVALNEKVNLETIGSSVVTTFNGAQFSCDFSMNAVPNMTPNTKFMPPEILDKAFYVKVKPTLQVDHFNWLHVFSLGDVAATGAPKQVLPIDDMAEVITKNISYLITRNSL
jgi:NADH dehydrogenase FAD-containing subunit